ncbi:phosphate ABC transporter, permease protein PstA [Helicobacter sp. 13S00401-1]|uniref:phosphate ABC transporter permease PstA n=1 Tax=Helicobacter sp. 13S00401-1 TaxID=1905758 RepID=UPI000BA55DF1|nr:phosphate ABC transporter permease PstA [Helicobacter sp. 13S00401-1]PAF50353.1 phosphate ABC transporter, permease protein PstA [Helicobacter sp. 13S00401-1]
MHNARLTRRKVVNVIALSFSYIFAIFGVLVLLFIIGAVLYKGLSHFGLHLFINDDLGPRDANSGLRAAIVGQIILAVGASIISIPIGLLAGTFLREYCRSQKLLGLVRMCSDLLNSMPTIIIATFIYAVVVLPTHGFSGYAGILALSIIMIPIVLKVTDDMLSLVPDNLKEAAMALGASKYKMITQIVYRAARKGLMTGILLAFCRVSGESAPLLFTASNSQILTLNPVNPMPSLSIWMYNFATNPEHIYQTLGWNAAFLLTAFILIVNIATRLLINRKK